MHTDPTSDDLAGLTLERRSALKAAVAAAAATGAFAPSVSAATAVGGMSVETTWEDVLESLQAYAQRVEDTVNDILTDVLGLTQEQIDALNTLLDNAQDLEAILQTAITDFAALSAADKLLVIQAAAALVQLMQPVILSVNDKLDEIDDALPGIPSGDAFGFLQTNTADLADKTGEVADEVGQIPVVGPVLAAPIIIVEGGLNLLESGFGLVDLFFD